jgi:hypothetical protein
MMILKFENVTKLDSISKRLEPFLGIEMNADRHNLNKKLF